MTDIEEVQRIAAQSYDRGYREGMLEAADNMEGDLEAAWRRGHKAGLLQAKQATR